MLSRFDISFNEVIGAEGGYTNNPNDNGNWTGGKKGEGELKGTKFGISAAAYPQENILGMTIDRAKQIYQHDYWSACKCDQLAEPLDLFVFDSAVNQGMGTAIKCLQEAIGADMDGIIGNNTLMLAKSRMSADAQETLSLFMAIRGVRYAWNHNFEIFGKGWLKRLFVLMYNHF